MRWFLPYMIFLILFSWCLIMLRIEKRREARAVAALQEMAYKLGCLLCHATGGKLSKHTYDLKTMETNVTDYINETYSEGYEEGKAEVAREIFEEIEQESFNGRDDDGEFICIYVQEYDEIKKKYMQQEEMQNETQSD